MINLWQLKTGVKLVSTEETIVEVFTVISTKLAACQHTGEWKKWNLTDLQETATDDAAVGLVSVLDKQPTSDK